MKGEQLELNLWEELRQAQQMPETVQVAYFLDAVETTASQLPEGDRLRFAGEALLQIAELCATRAGLLITEWEEAYRDPRVQRGFFDDLVRQTMAVDLGELIEPTPLRKPRTKRTQGTEPEAGSIAEVVDKAAILAWVDQLESEAALEEEQKQQVFAIAHDEDVGSWVEAISQWLKAEPNKQASFQQVCQGLGMPWVEVWLGVLLGGFELKQQGPFYQAPIWVRI